MDNNICAEIKRAAQVRGGNRIIYHQRDAVFVCDGSQFFDIHNIAGRISDRLAKDGPCIFIDGLLESVKIIGGYHANINALSGKGVGKEILGTTI